MKLLWISTFLSRGWKAGDEIMFTKEQYKKAIEDLRLGMSQH